MQTPVQPRYIANTCAAQVQCKHLCSPGTLQTPVQPMYNANTSAAQVQHENLYSSVTMQTPVQQGKMGWSCTACQ